MEFKNTTEPTITVSPNEIRGFQGPYRFLSNFFPAPLFYDGIEYPTSEHAYMACKTLDVELRRYIAGLETPALAKRAGRKLTLRANWESVKLEAMEQVVWAKFSQNPHLAEALLATGEAKLYETNDWGDVFYGCTPAGNGLNHLGKILEKVRRRLNEEAI